MYIHTHTYIYIFFFDRKANLLSQKQVNKEKIQSACCTDAAPDWPEKDQRLFEMDVFCRVGFQIAGRVRQGVSLVKTRKSLSDGMTTDSIGGSR